MRLPGLLLMFAAMASSAADGLPNVVLRTQENRPVRFYEDLVKGRVVLINFMFTSCRNVCPLASANMLKVQRALGDHVGRDIFMYSLTLDPEHDTPAVLREYAKKIGAGAGWTFLTGSPADLETLRRKLGLYELDPKIDADRTQHGAVIVYGNDASGRWSSLPALGSADPIAAAVRRVM
jgi:protein SCO1/2